MLTGDVLLLVVGAVFEDVSRGAIEDLTDIVEGGEADSLPLSGLENREVGGGDLHSFGELTERHFPLSHHDVEVYNYSHSIEG